MSRPDAPDFRGGIPALGIKHYVYTRVYMCMCRPMFVCMCVCMHVCMYVCMLLVHSQIDLLFRTVERLPPTTLTPPHTHTLLPSPLPRGSTLGSMFIGYNRRFQCLSALPYAIPHRHCTNTTGTPQILKIIQTHMKNILSGQAIKVSISLDSCILRQHIIFEIYTKKNSITCRLNSVTTKT